MLAWVMNLGFAASETTVAVGAWRTVAAQVYVPGAVASEVYVPGSVAVEVTPN